MFHKKYCLIFTRILFFCQDIYFSYVVCNPNLTNFPKQGFYSKSVTDSLLATQLDFVSYNGAPAPHEISSLDKICHKSGKKKHTQNKNKLLQAFSDNSKDHLFVFDVCVGFPPLKSSEGLLQFLPK